MNTPEIIKVNDKQFKITYQFNEIKRVIEGIAERLNNDYSGKTLTILIVLKGAMPFAIDLMKYINLDVIVETISAKSYGIGMISSRDVHITPSDLDVRGKEVLIIEDIVDTGHTLAALVELLKEQNPNSVEIAALFSKPEARETEVDVKYIGFEIEPKFIVGYGLDYAERGRHYPAVYTLID